MRFSTSVFFIKQLPLGNRYRYMIYNLFEYGFGFAKIFDYKIANFQKSGQILANFDQSTAVSLLKGIPIEKTYGHRQNVLHFIYNFNTKMRGLTKDRFLCAQRVIDKLVHCTQTWRFQSI
jgi:hypothetical protein